MNENDEIGLSEALKSLPAVLRDPARVDFWEAIDRLAVRFVGTFKHQISGSGRFGTVSLFHVIGDVFWFEVLQLRNAAGASVALVRRASLDDPPNQTTLHETGYYYVL